jgi:carboxymethylenebutenolidase
MCYELGSVPPYPPVSGGSGAGALQTLTSADGTEFSAFVATPDQPLGPGVVILPDIRGLHGFYQELALRFADLGHNAIAIDYFGRTAGLGPRDDEFDFMTHVIQTKPDNIAADTAAAIGALRNSYAATSLFTVGFCFGGRASFNQAARGHGLSGVIGFYGRVTPRDDTDDNASIAFVEDFECPVLGLFGGADPGIPPETVEEFRSALDAKGVANEIKIYDGAPHSFFDRAFDQFKDECDDAWRAIEAFIEKNSS